MPVGTVRETSRRGEESACFEWRVEEWRGQMGSRIPSPQFSFTGTDWHMLLYFSSERPHARLFCHPPSQEPVHCWLGVRRADGGEEEIASKTLSRGTSGTAWWKMPNLERREAQLAPSGTLTLLARISKTQETQENFISVLEEWGNLKKQYDLALIELEAAKEEVKLLKQENKNLLKDRKDFSDLQEHFKKLLSADDHDVLLKVQTKEFRAHKSVLRARSPVFEAMFRHGMKESAENTVDIEDCDPNCFGQFLEYVYTGQVEDLSPVNAPSLYFCGDKYGFPGLKRRCVDLLQSSLSAPLVSDVITMAMTHGEEGLLETTLIYVSQHLVEVTESVEWQRFATSNPKRAKELCLKAVKRRKSFDLLKCFYQKRPWTFVA